MATTQQTELYRETGKVKYYIPTDRVGDESAGVTAWDDMENLAHDVSANWAIYNTTAASIRPTGTSAVGTSAIEIAGSASNNPGMVLTFAATEDWSEKDTLTFYAAPTNDAAAGVSIRAYVCDKSGYCDYTEFVLHGTSDNYYKYAVELCDAGKGALDPTSEHASISWATISALRFIAQSSADDMNFAVDNIELWENGCVVLDGGDYAIPPKYTFTSNRINAAFWDEITIMHFNTADLTASMPIEYEVTADTENWINGATGMTSEDNGTTELVDPTENAVIGIRIVADNSANPENNDCLCEVIGIDKKK